MSSGVAFSENNRFLYVSTTLNVYQFDMESSNIASLKQLLLAMMDLLVVDYLLTFSSHAWSKW
ncbi:MAG: hypothetical protein R2784_15105 [Saprospiraceae bacterium]